MNIAGVDDIIQNIVIDVTSSASNTTGNSNIIGKLIEHTYCSYYFIYLFHRSTERKGYSHR